jgi:hypothetical protein
VSLASFLGLHSIFELRAVRGRSFQSRGGELRELRDATQYDGIAVIVAMQRLNDDLVEFCGNDLTAQRAA